MKKIAALITIIFSLFIFAGCTNDGSHTEYEKKDISNREMSEIVETLHYALGYTWSEEADSQLLTVNNGLFFRRALENIYEYENGEIPNTDWQVPVDFYVDTALEHFPWDEETVRTAVTAAGYNAEEDTVYLTDGLGSVRVDEITEINTDGDIITIRYHSGVHSYDVKTKTYFFSEDEVTNATLKIKKDEGKLIFISNENAYVDFINTKHLQKYVDGLSKALVYQWDENGGELLENPEHLKAALEGLYGLGMMSDYYPFPQTNGRARVDAYISVADRFLPFEENAVADLIRSCESYDAEGDTVAVSKVGEDTALAQITELEILQDGFVLTYRKETDRFTEGILTVENMPGGYYMFTSNKIVK